METQEERSNVGFYSRTETEKITHVRRLRMTGPLALRRARQRAQDSRFDPLYFAKDAAKTLK